ncbi:paxillin [Cladochytrium replicatum]|nr:paxillin [Cladochytrium replicatum]
MLALNDDDTGETSPTSVGDSKRFDNASNSQLSSASDSVRNKYECCVCEQLIASDKVVFALGKYWHVEHFACQGRGSGKTGKCDRLLANTPFFEHDETLYCDRCYYEEFSPKCAFCSEPIKETCISALGKTFHRDHFFCCQCGTTLDPGRNFMEYDGKAYCDDDYQALFSKPCFACCRPLTKEHIIAQGRAYHEDCFRCRDCRKLLTGLAGGFFEHEGQAYCEEHYYLRRDTSASVCPTCKKPVVGRVINALGRRYHADHFVCTFCKKSLISNGEKGPGITTSQFKEQQGKPYCNPCHIKLFG